MLEETSSVALASLSSQSRLSLDESELDLAAPIAARSDPVHLTARSPFQNGAVTQSTPLLAEQFLRSEFNQQDSMNLQVIFCYNLWDVNRYRFLSLFRRFLKIIFRNRQIYRFLSIFCRFRDHILWFSVKTLHSNFKKIFL